MKEICKLLDVIYTICLAVFVLACMALLFTQIVCLFLMNGPTSVWVYDFVIPKAGVVAAVMVIAVVLLSYLRHEKQADSCLWGAASHTLDRTHPQHTPLNPVGSSGVFLSRLACLFIRFAANRGAACQTPGTAALWLS